MSDKTALQFEQYWRKRISDELYAEHKVALVEGSNWRAVYFIIASGFVLRQPVPVLQEPDKTDNVLLNSDYHTDLDGRPE